MLKRTHLAISIMVGLYLFPYITHKFVFFPVIIFGTLFPDIDSTSSKIGRRLVSQPIHLFTNHRGIFHSFTLCVALSLLVAWFFPIAALPFFLGYSFHLLADSFTLLGIRPFWPLKLYSAGNIKTGGKTEFVLFWCFVIINVFLFLFLVSRKFFIV